MTPESELEHGKHRGFGFKTANVKNFIVINLCRLVS